MTCQRKVKERACKAPDCDETFIQYDSMRNWCSEACRASIALAKFEQKQARAKMNAKRERIAMKKEFKLGDRPYQVKLTQAVVNKYVVYVQEAGKGCYTCPKSFGDNKLGGIIDCGHWLTRGAHPEKARDVRQLRRQCVPCNRYHGGRPEIFEANLIAELGQEVVDDIRSSNPPKQTCDDLVQMRQHYSRMIREAGIK